MTQLQRPWNFVGDALATINLLTRVHYAKMYTKWPLMNGDFDTA